MTLLGRCSTCSHLKPQERSQGVLMQLRLTSRVALPKSGTSLLPLLPLLASFVPSYINDFPWTTRHGHLSTVKHCGLRSRRRLATSGGLHDMVVRGTTLLEQR
ncbi:hypothetical protein PISMIDRAFT_257161 [Pisolithus microcarpus 441]|uniref:Uncharacterized protein n=1 Tax=Pisolithus microcarpus 441 TaxID=765257 RepID=A0A0C9ZW63_9AGAM|nr:hypothetical protein PISMIDRAFT_257161 [Pisolithus microcarpus 441]